MADRTGIEWTDATWNPVRGCTRVSEGCRHCYAEKVAARFSGAGLPYEGFADRARSGSKWTGRVEVVWPLIDLPLRWRRPRRIFVNSMSDLFHEALPIEEIATVYAVMVAAHHLRGHVLQVLTKRPDRMAEALNRDEFWGQVNAEASAHVLDNTDPLNRRSNDARATLDEYGPDNPPPGIWLGTSVEDQPAADERIPSLMATPAAVRFLSCEPLLGPVDLTDITDRSPSAPSIGEHHFSSLPDPDDEPGESYIDWVIAGGESGPKARPLHVQWVRQLRDQCAAAVVPFFFKQWGEWLPGAQYGDKHRAADPGDVFSRFACLDWDLEQQRFDLGDENGGLSGDEVYRVGKRLAGNTLDGVQHLAFPA